MSKPQPVQTIESTTAVMKLWAVPNICHYRDTDPRWKLVWYEEEMKPYNSFECVLLPETRTFTSSSFSTEVIEQLEVDRRADNKAKRIALLERELKDARE